MTSSISGAGLGGVDRLAERRRRRSGDPRKRDPKGGLDARKARVRFGSATPRLFTAPLAVGDPGLCGCGCALTDESTFGFEAVRFAEQVVKVILRPWQRWLLLHGLELLPDGSFRFRNLVVLVARQNGKSVLSVILSLFFMYVLETKTILSAAQDLDTAEEIWTDGVALVTEADDDDQPVRPGLAAFVRNVVLVNGKKALVLTSGERWKVKAANRKAGRGLRGDLIILDELREQHNWYAWSAITKTTMARPNAQVWCFSNAGDVASVVLKHLRLKAHRKLGDPDGICAAEDADAAPTAVDVEEAVDDNPELGGLTVEDLEIDVDDLFLAEWSAAPGLSIWDRDGWAQSNPSLGYGDITERAIASAAGTDPEWEFRTEVLCQWPDGALVSIYDPGTWQATMNRPGPDGKLTGEDRIVGDVVAAVDVSKDGARAYVAFAGRRADGVAQAEIRAAQPGTDWIKAWLLKEASRIECVVGEKESVPASDVLATLDKDRTFTIPVVPIGGAEVGRVHGRCRGLLRDHEARHNPQAMLDQAAALAVTRPVGSNETIDLRRSPVDAAPIRAWEFALYQATQPAKFRPPPPPAPQAVDHRTVQSGRSAVRDFDPATAGF